MEDWQLAVLNSENIRVEQDQYTGYRLVIRKTERRTGCRYLPSWRSSGNPKGNR